MSTYKVVNDDGNELTVSVEDGSFVYDFVPPGDGDEFGTEIAALSFVEILAPVADLTVTEQQ